MVLLLRWLLPIFARWRRRPVELWLLQSLADHSAVAASVTALGLQETALALCQRHNALELLFDSLLEVLGDTVGPDGCVQGNAAAISGEGAHCPPCPLPPDPSSFDETGRPCSNPAFPCNCLFARRLQAGSTSASPPTSTCACRTRR